MRRADFAGPFDWIYSSAQMVRYRGPKIGQIDHRHGMISKDSHRASMGFNHQADS